MLAVLFVIIFVQIFALIGMLAPVGKRTSMLASVLPAVLTSITNSERLQNNAGPLTQNDLLQKAAQLKAEDMSERGYFAHTDPDGNLPWYWLNRVGYVYSYAGENLAVNFFDSKDVADAWMLSPAHRANIVKKNFTEIGIGVAHGMFEGNDTVFVVQFFGTPAIAQKSPKFVVKKPIINTEKKTIVATTPEAPVLLASEIFNEFADARVLGEEVDASNVLGVPASVQSVISKESPIRLFIQKILTSPRNSSLFLHQIVFVFVVLALLLAIFIKREIQHPVIIARGFALIAVIVLLGFANIHIANIQISVPMDDLYASTIQSLP